MKSFFDSRTFRLACTLLLICVGYFFLPQPVLSCGPFETTVLFFVRESPEPPLERYLQGELGIVQPTYGQDYLYAAYYQLSGSKFSAEAKKELLHRWHADVPTPEQPLNQEDFIAAEARPWLQARNAVPGVVRLASIETNRELRDYQFFVNCNSDAFASAARTLLDREKRFGATSRQIKDWVDAQDMVFSNCQKGAQVPGELEAGADPILRADRAYQIAAAHFYSQAFDEAEAGFRKIAADQGSPWQMLATYLVARVDIRRATLQAPKDQEFDPAALKRAAVQLEQVLSNPKMADLHPAARRLQGFVAFRLDPQRRAKELAANLLSANPSNLSQDLTDYQRLRASESDLSQWILAFQSAKTPEPGNPPLPPNVRALSWQGALSHWRQQKSLPWLIAALALAPADLSQASQDSADLLRAAQDLPKTSPGYLTATYYRSRLLLNQGRHVAVRALMDEVLAQRQSPGTANQFRLVRAATAKTSAEFLRDASLNPVATTSGEEFGEDLIPATEKAQQLPRLPLEAATAVDRLPHEKLLEASRSSDIGTAIRSELLNVGLTRSLLLDEPASVQSFIADINTALPALKPWLSGYTDARTAAERQFAAAFLLLHAPGMRPRLYPGQDRNTLSSAIPITEASSFRENWWCSGENYHQDILNSGYFVQQSAGGAPAANTDKPSLPFASEAELRAGADELQRLGRLPTAPDFLIEQVLSYAKVAPTDPRVPEALHLAVARAGKLGCTDEASKGLSREAFQLLHQKYPNSEWTKKTPYYY